MTGFEKSFVLGAILALATGCATSRGVMEIETQESANPDTGTALKIVTVSDDREFQIDPPQPDIPSLKNNEVDDPSITSRAIARKRNSFGKALGDILLPEGQTVMDLVASSLANGLRDNGYRVLDESDPGYDNAAPLEVSIEKFWGWFQPGFWQLKLHFTTSLRITGPVEPFTEGLTVDSAVERGYQIASTSNWRETIDANLAELNRKIGEAL